MKRELCKKFLEIVKNDSQKIALVYKGKNISYEKLGAYVVAVIEQLQKENITVEDTVAVYMTNSVELITTILAISYLNYKFIPLYVYNSQETKEKIVKDNNCVKILCDNLSYVEIEKLNTPAVLINVIENTELKNIELLNELSNDVTDSNFDLVQQIIHDNNLTDKSTLCLNTRIDSPLGLAEIYATYLLGAKFVLYETLNFINPLKIIKQADADCISFYPVRKRFFGILDELEISPDLYKNANIKEDIYQNNNNSILETKYAFNQDQVPHIYYTEDFEINYKKTYEVSKKDSEFFEKENFPKLSFKENYLFNMIEVKYRFMGLGELKVCDINKSFQTLGVDSLNYMQFIIFMEDSFDFEFDDDKIGIGTFNNLLEFIKYVGEKI